jgi:hypothetical protein
VITTEFLREWRAIIKGSKFKDIKINNQMLLCQHGRLPFDQNSWDDAM